MIRAVACALLCAGVSLGGAACSGSSAGAGEPTKPRADTGGAATVAAPAAPATGAPKLPASKRLLGRWEMKLNDAPEKALAKDFQRFKQSKELADMVRVEYQVTDTDWVLRKYGAGGVYDQKWKYQVLQENGDALVLERVGEDGQPQRIEVKVGEDTLIVGTGGGMVPLRRIK